jgi:hypothetical protein
MQIDKQTIVDFLRTQGQHDEAHQAESELPEKVDHEQHAGLLGKFGINPQELLSGKGFPKL